MPLQVFETLGFTASLRGARGHTVRKHPERRIALTLKRYLRRFLVCSDRPPFAALYRVGYRLAIWGVTLVLGGRRGLVAMYLCRGCAKGEITPGVSDIDLVLVTEGNREERAAIARAWGAIGRLTGGLVGYYPTLLMPRATLEHHWRTAPAWQHRFEEGRATWRLLAGSDVLGALPPLSAAQLRTAAYLEMTRWWLVFADQLLATRAYNADVVMRNVTCSKAVAELLNARHALRTGERRYSRKAGLAAADAPLAQRLAAIGARRFLVEDDALMDETLRFLVAAFVELWEGFPADPFLQVAPDVVQSVDARATEGAVGVHEALRLDVIREHLAHRWGGRCRGTHLVRSALWNLEDLILIVDADPARLPSVMEIADLLDVHRLTAVGQGAAVHLFLRVGPVCFPVAPTLPRDLHRGLLAPGTAPDVFLQLGHAEVFWTDYTRWYLADWRTNEQWLDADSQKREQLDIIAAGAAQGRVVYPLTVAAIARQNAPTEVRSRGEGGR